MASGKTRFTPLSTVTHDASTLELLVKLQNESLPKDIGQELLLVNNNV